MEMKAKATPEAIRIEKLLSLIDETRVVTDEKLHYRRQLQHMPAIRSPSTLTSTL
jgi:hypothetical protein